MKKLLEVLTIFLLAFVFHSSSIAGNNFHGGSAIKEGTYVPNTIIIKIKSDARALCTLNSIDEPKIKAAFARLGVSEVKKQFPHSRIITDEKNSMGKKYIDLSLVYKIHYTASINIEQAIRLIQTTGMVEYAEQKNIQRMFFTPNDPSIGMQYHLTKINAFNAWNVWQGDTNMVIGIVDSGTDWDHPDLVNSIKYNYADPINGIDDDNDGYVDNFRGWDISENDNSPMVVSSDHGSHVSGCAAATTNNGTGVAAPAFKCKFLPVKTSLDASTTSIDDGYEGITYAADHGCKVINCSWGSTGGASQAEQDVINYAAINFDAVVVVAAGNGGIEEDDFPASYENAVSVASTNSTDSKSGFSSYSYHVDVCAPGSQIYSTIFNNTYSALSGTSMASPVAAGCLAMVRSRFPNYNADQAVEQLKMTCDNIYGVGSNATYTDKLGNGRVNLFKAVSDTSSEGILVSNLSIKDGNDNVFSIGDTLQIKALFTSLLKPATNLTVTLSTASTYVQILNNSFSIGVLNTLDTISNYNLPFRVLINPSAPINAPIALKMTLTDGTYSKVFGFYVVVNVDYLNIDINDVATSITSIGRIGYNTSGPGQGLGFTYMGSGSLLYEAGLVTGTNATHVSDNIRSTAGVADAGYLSIQIVQHVTPGISDFDAYGKFNDASSTTTAPMNILIEHHAYAWTSVPDRNYVIVQYVIHNNATAALTNFYAGIFADWDVLPNAQNNRSSTDVIRKMGYCYSSDAGGYYVGIKLLTTSGAFNHYAIDNDLTGSGGVNMSDGYSTAEKYTTLSTFRANAGSSGTGDDVCDVTTSGPFTIPAGDSIVVAFALLAGQNLGALQSGGAAAQSKYDGIFLGTNEISLAHGFSIEQNFPNPVSKETNIGFILTENNYTELSIYNSLGEKVKPVLNQKLNAGKYSVVVDLSELKNGSYVCRLSSGKFTQSNTVVVMH